MNVGTFIKGALVATVAAVFMTGAASAATCTHGTGGSSATLTLEASSMAECFSGNDTNTIDASFSVFGMTGWVLADKNDDGSSGDQSITFTSGVINGDKSGTWAISSLGGASSVMVNLKAGNGWGSFIVDTLSGTWESSKDLSHASIYYVPGIATAPLPAAGWMLLAGVGGFAALRRRKKA